MKHIAILLGLSFAALAQQPSTTPQSSAPASEPVRLYIKAEIPTPATIANVQRFCPDVLVTNKPDAAQYQLDLDVNLYAGYFAGTLYKNGDFIASLDARAVVKGVLKAHLAVDPRIEVAKQVCQKIETTKDK
jgi:hypothetical protein